MYVSIRAFKMEIKCSQLNVKKLVLFIYNIKIGKQASGPPKI